MSAAGFWLHKSRVFWLFEWSHGGAIVGFSRTDSTAAMYLPSAFREDALDVQHDFIRAHPLGVVMTAGPGGLMANHIPCLLYPEGERGVLRLHMARANPQLAELASGAECLVAFHGPQAYVTPSWYATKAETHKVVPTWNFVAVHAWGKPVIRTIRHGCARSSRP